MPSEKLRAFLWIWTPAIVLMAIIFVLSGIPDPGDRPFGLPPGIGHFIGYTLLGVLISRATAGARWSGVTLRSGVLAWAICVAYAVSDEWHQSFVPGRTASIADWVIDGLGALTGIAIVFGARLMRRGGA